MEKFRFQILWQTGDLEFSKYSTGDKNTQTLINPPPGHKKKRNKRSFK